MTVGQAGAVLPGDRYKLIKLIGSGAFGEVWSALDLHRGQAIALKLLRDTAHRVAWREATLLTTLNSPHILKINNADLIGDVPFIDTKLAAGSLDKYASPLGMEPHRAVEAIRRTLRGLALCHSVHLLHRDVKPANIFEDTNGDIVLGDFGVAVLLESDGTAPCGGDARIVAPEGWTAGRLTVRSDIYSAGVTLYALLAGRWPFPQSDEAAFRAAVAAGDYLSLRDVAPQVSQALDLVVRRAMSADPVARFATASEFDTALGRLPTRRNRITPVQAHSGHVRCWQVEGTKSLTVCVSGSDPQRIEMRHAPSGRRISGMADLAVRPSRVSIELRRVFGGLR